MKLLEKLANHRSESGRPSRFGSRSVTGPVGLELDRDFLHLAQLEARSAAPALRAARSAPYGRARDALLADPRAFRGFVREALTGFRGRRVVSVVPDDAVKLMVLNYETESARGEPEQILGLVQERIDGPIEDCVVDYLPLRTAQKHGARSALAAVARRDGVIQHLELLRKAGLEVEALEIAPVAVRRLVVQLAGDDFSCNSLVIYCGARRSHLTMLAGRRLILYRELAYGEDQALEALAKSLDMTADSALEVLRGYGLCAGQAGSGAWEDPAAAHEISETVTEILKPGLYGLVEQVEMAAVYAASEWHGASVDKLLLLGRMAEWPGIDRMFTSLSGVPAEVLDPIRGLLPPDAPAEPDAGARLAVATGLALRGMGSGRG